MMLTFNAMRRATCLAATVVMLTACPDKETETAGATETSTGEPTSTTGTPTTDAPTTGGPTTDEPTTGTIGETMTGSTSGTTTTGDTIGGTTEGTTTTTTTTTTTEGMTDSTTGVIPAELDESCMSACEKFEECVDPPPFPDLDSCKAGCADALGEGPMCLELTVAFNNCMGGLNCQQFNDAFMNGEFGPCQKAFDAMETGCATCEGFGGVGPNGCSLGQQCPDQPSEEYACEGDTCTCLVDNQPVGDPCPADGFCDQDFEAQKLAAFACCGFEL